MCTCRRTGLSTIRKLGKDLDEVGPYGTADAPIHHLEDLLLALHGSCQLVR